MLIKRPFFFKGVKMKLKVLNVKRDKRKKKCLIEFVPFDYPLIIYTEMEYNSKWMIPKTIVDADVKWFGFAWRTSSMKPGIAVHAMPSCYPYSFLFVRIDDLLEVKLEEHFPYVKFKSEIEGNTYEVKLAYGERSEDDDPIEATFKEGDLVAGLFKAYVDIKEIIK